MLQEDHDAEPPDALMKTYEQVVQLRRLWTDYAHR